MTEQLKPLPCPFCGGTDIRAHVYGGGEPDAFMQCHDCSADGPNGLNRAGAIEAWNRRAQPAQAGQVLDVVELMRAVLDADQKTTHTRGTTNWAAAIGRSVEQAVMAKRVPQWLPIETAPKDFVSEFDGWNGERVPNVSWAHPEYSPKGHFDWCVSEYETGHGWVNVAVKNLTHWMPLPPPPGIVGEKGGA